MVAQSALRIAPMKHSCQPVNQTTVLHAALAIVRILLYFTPQENTGYGKG
jgi:hypothetical protein